MAASIDTSPFIEKFEEFFTEECKQELTKIKANYPQKKSFYFSFKDLEKFDHNFADDMLEDPDNYLEAAQLAVVELAGAKITKFEPHVRVTDLPDTGVLIQEIGASHIRKLIRIEGVVTKRAEVRPKVQMAVYICGRCDNVMRVPIVKGTHIPDTCDNCHKKGLELDEEKSYFTNLQRAEMQELLERVRGGSPASNIELMLEDDLVNVVIPGDTVEITGVVRIRPIPKQKGVYAKFIEVVHVKNVQKDFEEVELSKEDIRDIKKFAQTPKAFEQIVKSVAPSIYGHTEVKEALVLQVFGGTKGKTLPEGGRIRNDIHILLIGDPGVSKSRLLQYMTMMAPKSIYVSGKSASGAGLTAAAEKDDLGEGWTLKAGALVLASGGLGGIDEFDKIEKHDQAALHEVMESGSVSVAKAGMVAKFKAETTILAAANPRFGRFDPNQLPVEQFDIPPTLLSRFDLIFPIKDVLDEERDKELAQHILSSHRKAAIRKGKDVEKAEVVGLPQEFLRKYVAFARKNVHPIMTQEASDKIKEYYIELRKLGQSQGAVAITPRQIEGLVRLSEASAKVRLDDKVNIEDAERAIRLTDFVIKQIALDRETGKIDIDIIATGQPRSKAEQYYDLVGVIRDLSRHYDQVAKEMIIDEAKKVGMTEVAIRKFLDEMQRKGELFEPKPGYLKLVQKGE